MKFGGYAFTVGPAGLIELILAVAKKRGHDTVLLEKNKHGVVDAEKEKLLGCDVVLLGFSTVGIEEEVLLAEFLLANGIPYIVPEDVPGSSLRPGALHLTARARKCIVATSFAVQDAEHAGYKDVEYLGPPQHWRNSYIDMVAGEKLRSTYGKKVGSEILPLTPDDRIVHVAGGKLFPEVINDVIAVSIDGGKRAYVDNLVFSFGKHPGEQPDPKKGPEEKERYDKAWAERDKLLSSVSRVESRGANNANMVGSADITVYTGIGPTESIISAYLRKLGIFIADSNTERELKKVGYVSGRWFVEEKEGVMGVPDIKEISLAIHQLATAECANALREKQAVNFTLPANLDWNSAPIVVRVLGEIVALG